MGRVYGRVSELITGDPRDGLHPYVGQTRLTIHQRVHGSGGHTSPESIRKDPWKARILPAAAGYRLLRTVYATADPAQDQDRLNALEALMIDELRTTHNTVRPIRSPGQVPPVRVPQPRESRRLPFRFWAFAVLACALIALVARVVVAMHLPWPAAPWVASPVLGVVVARWLLTSLQRETRRLTRPTPRRRR
jgi:hypothetical protein